MATVEVGVRASVGFASKTGPRKNNEDFAGALIGAELPEPRVFSDEEIQGWLAEDEAGMRRFREGT